MKPPNKPQSLFLFQVLIRVSNAKVEVLLFFFLVTTDARNDM